MEEYFKSKLGFIVFFIIIVTFAVGGYFFTDYMINNKDGNKKYERFNEDYKIDKSKDYIYFENEEVISADAEIYYKDVFINLETQKVLNEALKKENEIYKTNVIHISDVNLISSELIKHNYDNLYSFTFRDYKVYEFDRYISLVINDYNYSCFDFVTFKNSKSYVFDKKTGDIVDNSTLLEMYDKTYSDIKTKVENYLSKKQSKVDGVEVINIEETVNSLENAALYINDYGVLEISYLVKTTQTDYNEITEV